VNGAFGNWGFNNNETGLPYLQASSVAGGNLGSAYASFLLGLADSASVATPKDPQFRKTSWSLFAQDTWKVTRKLTVTYGLRWGLQGAPHEIHDRFAEFSPTTPNPSVGGLLGATIYAGSGPGRCNCSFTNTYPLAIGPRLGAAWQLNDRTVLRAGWGVTYGYTAPFNYIGGIIGGSSVGYNSLSFVSPGVGTPAATFAQGLPYTQDQLYPSSLSAGIVPFTGQLNSPPYYIDPNGGRPPPVNRWNISLQHSTKDLLVEAAYVGNRGAWLLANNLIDLNGLTPQALAARNLNVANAADRTLLTSTFASGKPQAAGFQLPYSTFPQTSTLAQALRPFPQFGNIAVNWAPLGNSWYDALQAKVTQRLWHGLYAQYVFTWQKELTTAEGIMVNDVYNRPVQKAISGSSIPLVSAMLFNYQVPVFASNKYLRAFQRDWTIGGSLRFQSGLPILSPIATNNITTVLPRQSSTFANRNPGVPLFTQDPNCHCFDPNQTFVLNSAAWSQPAAGQFGTAAPYYNRVFLSAPTSTNSTATQVKSSTGQTVSGFGYINTSVTSIQTGGAVPTVRNGQIVARLVF
ncbi:MAG: TonB-dependent receptor, partial [Acidobacteriota bacterium]|nr:TonB-dependent receptor [Acidobacteriota bacterium]